MLDFIFILLASYSLSFLIKETDGPFDIISKLRNYLMRNKYIGVFFYKLLSCYYCCGFWSGLIIYLIYFRKFQWNLFILYGLTSAIFSLIMSSLLIIINIFISKDQL